MKNRASTFMEYAIILGVVAAALMTMNIYIKRGVQGRVKDMADNFINDGRHDQAVEVDPEVETTSETSTGSNSTLTDETSFGGGKQLALLDNTSVEANSVTRDTGKSPNNPDTGTFVPADAGQANYQSRPRDEDFVDPNLLAECGEACNYDPNFESEWKTSVDIAYLTREKTRFLTQADKLDESAQVLDAKADELRRRAAGIHCPRRHGGSCRSAKRSLANTADQINVEATGLRADAADLRTEAGLIQEKIDDLEG